MKSLWEKATEIGSRAKNIATVYLGTEKEELEENQDHIKTLEKSEISLEETKDSEIKNNISTIEEPSANIKEGFNEKEKNYISHIDELEKTIDLKNLEIERLEKCIKEIEDKMKEGIKLFKTKIIIKS